MSITNRVRNTDSRMYAAIKNGKAGEHLVCYDLLIKGYEAFIVSDSASPFDIILQYNNKLLKLQTKSTSIRRYNSTNKRQPVKQDIPCYYFNVGICGYECKARYRDTDVDIYCFVSLETKDVAYIKNIGQNGSVCFRIPELKGQYKDEKRLTLQPKIESLINSGRTNIEVAETLGISIDDVSKFKSKKAIKKTVRYINDFPIEKCLLNF